MAGHTQAAGDGVTRVPVIGHRKRQDAAHQLTPACGPDVAGREVVVPLWESVTQRGLLVLEGGKPRAQPPAAPCGLGPGASPLCASFRTPFLGPQYLTHFFSSDGKDRTVVDVALSPRSAFSVKGPVARRKIRHVALNRAVALGRPQCRAPTLPSSETPRLPGTLRPEAVPPTPRPAMAADRNALAVSGPARLDGAGGRPGRVASARGLSRSA